MTKNRSKRPCDATKLLTWLGDIQCCTDKFIYEWCDLFDLDQPTRKQFEERYGERLIGLTTFVNFWLCRDLPSNKKIDKYEKRVLIGPGDRRHSSKGMPWEDDDSASLFDDLMYGGEFKDAEPYFCPVQATFKRS